MIFILAVSRLKPLAVGLAALQILLFSLAPREGQAQITVPDCQALKDFGLDWAMYRNRRIEKVFGAALSTWTNDDLAAFRKGFLDCRKANPTYWRNYFGNDHFKSEVIHASNTIAARINRLHQERTRIQTKSKPSL